MALSDAVEYPTAFSNGEHHPLSATGNDPSSSSTLNKNCQDPLTAASSDEHLTADGDQSVIGEKIGGSHFQQKKQKTHVIQRLNRPTQNGGVLKQNGSLTYLPPSSAVATTPTVTDSQRLGKRHLPSSLSACAPSTHLHTPPFCCQQCHFQSPLCSNCGQQECLRLQNPGAGPGASSIPNHGTTSACLCCHSACTYSHPHPHPSSPFCLHQQHHQRWQEHVQNQAPGRSPARPFRFPKSYAELIADWPVVVLGVCTVLTVVCALVGILVPDLPDFSDPLRGFEPRGTAIGQRLVTWSNMVKNTGYKATLANYPFKYADEQAKNHQEPRWPEEHFDRDKRQAEWDFSKDFFCDVPGDSYSRLVFASAEGKNLWNIQAIKSMCNLDNSRVRSHRDYWSLCQRTNDASCCPSWTLGTAILVNYILMVTWLPAVVVLHERYLPNMFPCSKPPHQERIYGTRMFWTGLCQKANKCLFTVSEASRIFFEKVLPCIVIKLRYIWLFWFLAITVGGAYVVCVNPKMKLPSLELAEFQVFRASHPFERYDAEYKKLFMFERVHHGEDLHMPITIIWGVTPVDNGDPLNPKNKGKLMLDNSFNIASPASQLWILNFCQKLRNQSFVFQSEEQDFTSCFIETFKQWMENQDCEEASVYPCCSQSTFPYKQEVFELCIKRAIMELDRSTNYHLDSKTPGPRFDINDTIRAIVLEFKSTYLFTLAYEKMFQFYCEVDAWITEELRNAPAGLRHGWFISNLEFYDLQDSLSDGTLVAMALSVAVAFSVMLLTTWNVIISLYAILSIGGTIFVTVGSLVLLGWELNVLESVTISVAVGLSVDFAVHYGVAYRLAPEPDREGKVIFSLSRMGSAIAMAALTTFVAGAMMMPSTVLAYTQLGTFMMLIMCISWAFATFFFQCMCRCLGPQGTCGQIPLPKKLQCQMFSEVTSTSPSPQGKGSGLGKYQLDSRGEEVENYELEPLASCQKTEDKPLEEQEVCAQLYNGLSPHHHTAAYSHINYKNKTETGRNGPENGLVATLSTPTGCQISQKPNYTCGDPPPPAHLPQQWTTCSCAQTVKDSPSCPPTPQIFPLSGNSTSKQNAALLSTNLNPVFSHVECHMHYVNCPPAHFHHCSQGRVVAPRKGPAHSCHLRKYCVHNASQQGSLAREQISTTTASNQDTDSAPGSVTGSELVVQEADHRQELIPSSSVNGQNISTPAPTQHQTHCPSPPPCTQQTNDHCCGDSCVSTSTTTNNTTISSDACCKSPGTQEKLESVPITRDKSAKKCKQNTERQRASSVSPKKLCGFSRTLKVKCSSASEFNVPKTETSVPSTAIKTNPSSESLC
ncbi:protein dispatched homolog 1 isoform X2 [Labrus mixtus]|uniref:protein dispatched homolog 1 isoform X2 n=1 Tax=Labrus mixtus TaxID=508554 RepID=UPI0029C01E1E|nr:protein dispatched homolog 1 isoform X2 [Labrus mixtus]